MVGADSLCGQDRKEEPDESSNGSGHDGFPENADKETGERDPSTLV
jgi:hypothetical protein